MNCANCGAPLPPTSHICVFCRTLNDTDLHGITTQGGSSPSQLICPRCDKNLENLVIGESPSFAVERCPECLGLFFDPGELEMALDHFVTHVYDIDFQRIGQLCGDERRSGQFDGEVRYLKCPRCRTLMMRRNFGTRSGVIIDTCKACGAWLDGGEFGQLLRWVKSGGRILDQQRKQEADREEERRQAAEKREEELRRMLREELEKLSAPRSESIFSSAWRALRNLIS